ncbi:MAG: hypothetical protein M1830_001662 [Pleopsidium flavum]|nr:MAG: hypothetical protein M1830_001662 [Pleopsidium flavum]
MITRLKPSPSALRASFKSSSQCVRSLHQHMSAGRIPSPTPFVPNAQTFLALIGRNLSQHAAKIPSWEALFSLTSKQLRELGVEPARSRRYLLRWREKFRNGEYGIGGDLKEVVDGSGEVKVVAVPNTTNNRTGEDEAKTATSSSIRRKVVVSVPQAEPGPALLVGEAEPVKGLKVRGAHTITGPHVELVEGTRGSVARIKVKEGLWEQRRGHKVDGGERRKAEVRAKRRSEERRTTRK